MTRHAQTTTTGALQKDTQNTLLPQATKPISLHPLQQLQQALGNRGVGRFIQAKLKVSQPGDAFEQEADRVADQVMRMPDAVPLITGSAIEHSPAPDRLQRACAKCEESDEDKPEIHRKAASIDDESSLQAGSAHGTVATHSAEAAVRNMSGAGAPLSEATRSYFEPRFQYDFGRVRVHADGEAATAASAVRARAYTLGRDIVFGSGEYSPSTEGGQRLLAHELTHVVQQNGAASTAGKSIGPSVPGNPDRHAASRQASSQPSAAIAERTATSFVARVNTPETAAVLRTGTRLGSGVQFWPLTVTNTQIGPVSGEGGLLNDQRDRLSVIVGTAMTLRNMAGLVLPLWNSATPFTPAGSTTPLITPALTADELARGLLVYNRYYLRVLSQPVASMTGWTGGLRFPLPVQIDAAGVATVNKTLMQSLASGFDATWESLLDQSASAVVAPAQADLSQQVADFLTAKPDPMARGFGLAARSITNAVDARPFVLETFSQAAAGSFDIALSFMDMLVNSQVSLLASQRDGSAILGGIRAALAGAPATPTTKQQESLTRANLMLGLVTAIVPRNPPFASPNAISAAGTHMIAAFEGFCPNLYDDATANCGVGSGNCTIGFGHLVHLGPCNGDPSETPFLAGLTRPAAEAFFANELTRYVNDVRNALTVPVSQAQFDALVSFHYNTGRMNSVAPSINANNFAAVPGIMNQFVNARINGVMTQLGGLVTRRASESTLFSTGAYPP